MSIPPITFIDVNLGPEVGSDDTVVGVRVVTDRREGRMVYGRTLNYGEPDNGEAIMVEPGDTLVCPQGSVKVMLADVDRYSEPESDGYSPLANTVWTWLAIPPRSFDVSGSHYLLAAARRLDMAHVHCRAALTTLQDCPGKPFVKARALRFDALGHAESMCIALRRVIGMIQQANARFSIEAPISKLITGVEPGVRSIRDAFEHIDERAEGRARHKGPSSDAMSIFDQSDFFVSGILRYASHSLDIQGEAVPAMIAARKFIVDAAAEAGKTKTINVELKWTFTAEADSAAPTVSTAPTG